MSSLACMALIKRCNILLLIVVIAMSILPSAYASDSIERRVTGEWRFTAALDGAEIASLDEREAQQLLGQVFTIRKEQVKFGKWTAEKRRSKRARSNHSFICAKRFMPVQSNLACPRQLRSST